MIINSRNNNKLKEYNKLKTQKKERISQNLITLEGFRLINDCVNQNIKLKELIITKAYYSLNKDKLKPIMNKFHNTILIEDDLKDILSDVKNSQGIFAIVSNPALNIENLSINKNECYVALSKLSDPGNLGTIIRTAAGLGFSGVIIDNCCDPFSPKVIRSTMGAIFKIPIYISVDLSSYLIKIKDKIKTFGAVTQNSDFFIDDKRFDSGLLIIGNEAHGLDENIKDIVKYKVKIPLFSNIESFNASTAASICMYEMKRKIKYKEV